MIRYVVTDPVDKWKNAYGKFTSVLHVRKEGDPEHEKVSVWRSERSDGSMEYACCECQGPLVAMSSSCVHARAAKRADAAGKIIKKPGPKRATIPVHYVKVKR